MVEFDKPLDIVVVGGSLGGLFASASLLRLPAGHKITILERSPTPLLHSTGAGIVAGSETLQWFEQFDVSGRVIPSGMSVLSQARYYLDQQGAIIDGEEMRQRMTSWEMLYYALRWNVDGLESGYVSEIQTSSGSGSTERRKSLGRMAKDEGRVKYRHGCEVTDIVDQGSKVEIKIRKTTEDGQDGGNEILGADIVIVADGPSSRMRKLLLGDSAGERTYAGYVAFRGTAEEEQLSEQAKKVFVERFTFYHGEDPNTQILAYTIPGPNGTVEEGKRLVNWVWYWNFETGSQELEDLMTDKYGNRHRLTVPTGGNMQPKVLEKQQNLAREFLPPQYVEIIEKTENPFVQAITDLVPPEKGTQVARLLNGKAVLVGDALSGFRPHTAASTSQAAYHGLLLNLLFQNKISSEQYEEAALEFAWSWQTRGVMLGDRSQFGSHPLAAQNRQKELDRSQLWLRK